MHDSCLPKGPSICLRFACRCSTNVKGTGYRATVAGSDFESCSFCDQQRKIDEVLKGRKSTICASCIRAAAHVFEARGKLRGGTEPPTRQASCSFCRGEGDLIRATPHLVCLACCRDIGRLILNTSRDQLTEIFHVAIEEATSIRKVSGGLSSHVYDSGQTHASLAKNYLEAGDYGDALAEAGIALMSQPPRATVVRDALSVVFNPSLAMSLTALQLKLKRA
jgi:hypothetical protein